MCGHGPRISRSRLSIFYFHRTNSPNPWRPDLKENEAVGAPIWQNHLSHFFGFIAIFVFHRVFSSKDGPSRFFPALGFRRSQLPKVVRTWCVLYILTSKCASRHNGVHFFISHLARCLRTRRFSEPTFRPPEPQIIGKTQ